MNICRMARATLGGSNCPCQEDNGEGPYWCYVLISHDPVLNILEAPYYENPFEVVPIVGEYFIENIIVTHFENHIKFTQLEISISKLPLWYTHQVQWFRSSIWSSSWGDTTITNPMFGETNHDLWKLYWPLQFLRCFLM